MNKENTEKLFTRFKFFRPERSIRESLMAFGFECGDGWFELIWNLCSVIEILLPPKAEFEVLQVKEKYGGLRFYFGGGGESFDLIQTVVNWAENQSENICEVCGEWGKSYSPFGWVVTLCDKDLTRYVARRIAGKTPFMPWDEAEVKTLDASMDKVMEILVREGMIDANEIEISKDRIRSFLTALSETSDKSAQTGQA